VTFNKHFPMISPTISLFRSSSHRLQAVISSKTILRLHHSLIWQNLYQIHVYETRIYRSMEDQLPLALKCDSMRHHYTCLQGFFTPAIASMHRHSCDRASRSTPIDKSNTAKFRSKEIWSVQASTRPYAPLEGFVCHSTRCCNSSTCCHVGSISKVASPLHSWHYQLDLHQACCHHTSDVTIEAFARGLHALRHPQPLRACTTRAYVFK
jgi:hypothetical protein